MLAPSVDGFYDLTSNSDNFNLTPGFLTGLPGGLRSLDGDDFVVGSSDVEIIHGNKGKDSLFGGAGSDALFGGKDDDFLNGNEDADILFGNDGSDLLFGGDYNDHLYGNLGKDQLYGEEGWDLLFGGKDDDLLTGGEGGDILSGDMGRDTLIGGEGQDTIAFRSDAAVTDIANADVIRDFANGSDRIGLSGGLTAADISLETASITAGSSGTLMRVKASGGILGFVEGVSVNEIGSDRFVSLDGIFATEARYVNEMTSAIAFNNSIVPNEALIPVLYNLEPNALPAPFQILSASKQVPTEFLVNVFTTGLQSPTSLSVTSTGEVLVTEAGNQVRSLRDVNGDGVADIRAVANSQNGSNPSGNTFATLSDGSLLLSDSVNGKIYRIQSNDFFIGRTILISYPFSYQYRTAYQGESQVRWDALGGEEIGKGGTEILYPHKVGATSYLFNWLEPGTATSVSQVPDFNTRIINAFLSYDTPQGRQALFLENGKFLIVPPSATNRPVG